jgi:hypothetical protein
MSDAKSAVWTQEFAWRQAFAKVDQLLVAHKKTVGPNKQLNDDLWTLHQTLRMIAKHVPNKAQEARQSLDLCVKKIATTGPNFAWFDAIWRRQVGHFPYSQETFQLKQMVGPILHCWIDSFLATRLTGLEQEKLRQHILHRADWAFLSESRYTLVLLEDEQDAKQSISSPPSGATAAATSTPMKMGGMHHSPMQLWKSHHQISMSQFRPRWSVTHLPPQFCVRGHFPPPHYW